MRDLTELTDVDKPAWPLLAAEISESRVSMDTLPADPSVSRDTLLQLQITARSWLGAFVLNSGGLILDSGWLRIYGSPEPGSGMPSLAQVNALPARFDPLWRPGAGLVVGHDVLGGAFVLNGPDAKAAGRPGEPGEVVYFAPDSLRWEALGAGHDAWLGWLLSTGTEQFYDNLRWPGWRGESGALTGTQGLSITPFLWSADARRDLNATSRRAAPLSEILDLHRDYAHRLDSVDPGFLGDLKH
ncbi:DUF2625 family protein [Streptomyces sp. NPDC008313]|uniref:DUF2625 family protein n=1 Tax=Streptomyces sp. NPDC008313 TaxID=3364826 RepID=UPI0036EBCEA2